MSMDAMDEHEEPRDVEVFYPKAVELIDPGGGRTAPGSPQRRRSVHRVKTVAVVLFLATCVSTFIAGLDPGEALGGLARLVDAYLKLNADQFRVVLLDSLYNGLLFGGSLMAILFAHEMGHYLQARRYGVPASLPFFIPLPISPFGTMGAVIFQGSGVANRKMLFDIAISGPLAGLVIALPVAYLGILQVTQALPSAGEQIYGVPLLLRWMMERFHGPLGPGGVELNPLLFAGWVGIFITALNLIPIGQLDGGHILYTLIGRRAHIVARLLLLGAIAFMIYTHDPTYGLIVLLLFFMGPLHPPTANDRVPLGWPRIVLGWLTLAFIVIGFTPHPISAISADAVKSQEKSGRVEKPTLEKRRRVRQAEGADAPPN